MSDELKACPFCNKPITAIRTGDSWAIDHDQDCPMDQNPTARMIWQEKKYLVAQINTRPIEDALRADLVAAKGELINRALSIQDLTADLAAANETIAVMAKAALMGLQLAEEYAMPECDCPNHRAANAVVAALRAALAKARR